MFTKIMLTSETAFTNRQREKHTRPDVSSVIALIGKIAKPVVPSQGSRRLAASIIGTISLRFSARWTSIGQHQEMFGDTGHGNLAMETPRCHRGEIQASDVTRECG